MCVFLYQRYLCMATVSLKMDNLKGKECDQIYCMEKIFNKNKFQNGELISCDYSLFLKFGYLYYFHF